MSELETFNQLLSELSPVPLSVVQVTGTNKFNLMSGTRALYQGSFTRVKKYALSHIDNLLANQEQRAVDNLQLFCYLPYVTKRISRYYQGPMSTP